ncbi:MAG: enoyl-CoA hydratase [Gammaproteobacteria bacterium]|nr:MAG: enoyl-CoA hydratase [Gammaproteobacteria bacterium]RLA51883.1 MAG: enoyl-CoA hydratase [Gammaproteobacteria bacterium]
MDRTNSVITGKDKQGIGRITINRPEAYNALSINCMESLIDAFSSLSADDEVRVIVLAGSGKGFCAGHDLAEMRGNPERDFQQQTFSTCTTLMLSIVQSPKPVIAKVHGVATAAGCQLVASCDLAVAEQNARFATPGVNLGLFCSTPMVALSRNVSRKHAMEMLLLGDFISAQRAYEMGFINYLASADKLEQTVDALAAKIASKSSLTLKIGKQAFYRQLDKNLIDAYDYCGQVMVENMMARDAQEGIDAFMEKRAPIWRDE